MVFVACVPKANCNPPVTCAARPGEAGSWCYIFSSGCIPASWTAISCASFDCGIR